MSLWRKKPVVVEATQFFPDRFPHPDGVETYVSKRTEAINGTENAWFAWRIKTLEGWHEVSPGDWIITGVKGERYPCKPDIFNMTYEFVQTDTEPTP